MRVQWVKHHKNEHMVGSAFLLSPRVDSENTSCCIPDVRITFGRRCFRISSVPLDIYIFGSHSLYRSTSRQLTRSVRSPGAGLPALQPATGEPPIAVRTRRPSHTRLGGGGLDHAASSPDQRLRRHPSWLAAGRAGSGQASQRLGIRTTVR